MLGPAERAEYPGRTRSNRSGAWSTGVGRRPYARWMPPDEEHENRTLAYDLVVANEEPAQPGRPAPLLAGWAGPEGPAIDPSTWPRSPRTGQPLTHCVTIWLPEPYRRLHPDAVAVSLFQWGDWYAHLDRPLDHMLPGAVPDQTLINDAGPFWSALATSRPHPRSAVVADPLAGCSFYGLVHLTHAEFVGPRQPRPPAAPLFPEEMDTSELPARTPVGTIWLVQRDDPNAGLAPEGPGYQQVPDRYDRFQSEHLGGTLMDPDDDGAGTLSPFYLELYNIGGFDAGGHDQSFDLALEDPLAWNR